MKFQVPITLISLLLVSACACSLQDNVSDQPPVKASGPSAMYSYQCDNGETLRVNYPFNDSATVLYQGINYQMKIAVSGSGTRYVHDEFEWWTKGMGSSTEGTILRHMVDGSSGEIIARCTGI